MAVEFYIAGNEDIYKSDHQQQKRRPPISSKGNPGAKGNDQAAGNGQFIQQDAKGDLQLVYIAQKG